MTYMRTSATILACALGALLPQRDAVSVRYTVSVDSTDLSGFRVEIRIHNAPDTLRLAMATHPEYDDRYWRFVRDMHVDAAGRDVAIVREDSAVWRIAAHAKVISVRYRIALPPQQQPGNRPAWRPSLRASGGLIGDIHSFMYLVGHTGAPVTVALELPRSWSVATGLERAAAPRTYTAHNTEALLDSPILVGTLVTWRFSERGTPHEIVYLAQSPTRFDTAAFTRSVRGLVHESATLFRSIPYRRYVFLFQDSAYGALEHATSVTLGTPAAELAVTPRAYASAIAHEYFHTWNLVTMRPVGREHGVSYLPAQRTNGLWWSEGVTLYYANVLTRRAHITPETRTRLEELQETITRYVQEPGNTKISPERASRAANDPPGTNGDLSSDYYAQGQLIGSLLDIAIRSATTNRKSLDDVMRAMSAAYSTNHYFETADIERIVNRVCACSMNDFFDKHVRAAQPLDFNQALTPLGVRVVVTNEPAKDRDGRTSADTRVGAYLPQGAPHLKLIITNPQSAWARAGITTGDDLIALNGTPIPTMRQFRAFLSQATPNDTVHIDFIRQFHPRQATLTLHGYDVPVAHIVDLPTVTPAQAGFRADWSRAAP
jgi:predicted metalloprotease with PDZ domain